MIVIMTRCWRSFIKWPDVGGARDLVWLCLHHRLHSSSPLLQVSTSQPSNENKNPICHFSWNNGEVIDLLPSRSGQNLFHIFIKNEEFKHILSQNDPKPWNGVLEIYVWRNQWESWPLSTARRESSSALSCLNWTTQSWTGEVHYKSTNMKESKSENTKCFQSLENTLDIYPASLSCW